MDIGKVSESKAMYALIELGWTVAIPFSDSAKYDLISESNEGLKRIQVKTANHAPSSVAKKSLPKICFHNGGKKRTKYKSSEIDLFIAVYKDQVLATDEFVGKSSVSISKMKPLCEHPLFVKL